MIAAMLNNYILICDDKQQLIFNDNAYFMVKIINTHTHIYIYIYIIYIYI